MIRLVTPPMDERDPWVTADGSIMYCARKGGDGKLSICMAAR